MAEPSGARQRAAVLLSQYSSFEAQVIINGSLSVAEKAYQEAARDADTYHGEDLLHKLAAALYELMVDYPECIQCKEQLQEQDDVVLFDGGSPRKVRLTPRQWLADGATHVDCQPKAHPANP